jgi:hypothetical protein
MYRVILFITEMPMATMLVLVFQDTQALDLIALGRISLPPPSLSQFLLQEEILKDLLSVCLFVCVWSVAVEASAFTAHRVKCTTSGCVLAAPRREGTGQQYLRQYQNPFAPHLFTNISPALYIFCSISLKAGLFCPISDFKLVDTLFIGFLFVRSSMVASLF